MVCGQFTWTMQAERTYLLDFTTQLKYVMANDLTQPPTTSHPPTHLLSHTDTALSIFLVLFFSLVLHPPPWLSVTSPGPLAYF